MIWGSPAPVVPRSVIPSVLVDSNFTQSGHLVRSHRRPDRVASLLKDAPLPMLNQNDAQTEDGHAMMKFDTFQSFRDLSHTVRGCNETVNKCAQTSRLTSTCHKKPAEK